VLVEIWESIHLACEQAGTTIVTGDTKVMGHGELDGLILNTTGIGWTDRVIRDAGLRPGDRILVTGTVGDHGLAVMATRNELALETALASDVAPLNGLVRRALAVGGEGIVASKDPTRGGLSSALHEMAEKSGVGIVLDERAIPMRDEVRAVGELLGIDPLLVANEGKAVFGIRPERAEGVLEAIRADPLGRDAALIGECVAQRPGFVVLDTGFGSRLLVEAEGELLPRIC
jgi:hydrogenase expression/formation protein HypE